MARPSRHDGSAEIGATDLKQHCLRLLDEVRDNGTSYVITKRGKPVARLVPIAPPARELRGAWKGRVRITGDIVHCDWSDLFDACK